MSKAKLKCRTPAKAQVNFRKAQRVLMNRKERRRGQAELGRAVGLG